MSREVAGDSVLRSYVDLYKGLDKFPIINIGNVVTAGAAYTVFSEIKKRFGNIVAGVGSAITFGALWYVKENLFKGNAIYPIIPGLILGVCFGMRILESRKSSEDKEQLLSLLMDKHLKLKELETEYEGELENLETNFKECLAELKKEYENKRQQIITRVDGSYSDGLQELEEDSNLQGVGVDETDENEDLQNENINGLDEDDEEEKVIINDNNETLDEKESMLKLLNEYVEHLDEEGNKEIRKQQLLDEWGREKATLLKRCEESYNNEVCEAYETFDKEKEDIYQEYLQSVFEYANNELIDSKMKIIKTKVL